MPTAPEAPQVLVSCALTLTRSPSGDLELEVLMWEP